MNAQVKAAKSLLETAESGTDYGQYPAAVLEDVQTALTAAEGLTQDSLQYEVDQAALALRKAVSAARNQQIISGPVSKDGQIDLIYDSQKAEMNVKSDVTKIDIQVKKGVPMPETIVTGTGVSMTVPAGTAANGNYRLPLVGGNPGGQFKLGDVSKVYGAGASPATVDQPVRIVLQGEAAKTVAYRNEQSSYTQVLKTIEEDTAAAAVAAMAGTRNKAVRINVGNDAVLYSYLITEYVTFTPKAVTPTPTPTPENPGGGTVVNPPSSGGTTGSGNINVTPLNQFRDIAGHWAEKDIQEMAKKGIVSGVTDTTFEPDRSITRAEFATLVVKALNLKSGISAGFTDVPEGAWSASYVNAAANAGLISGYAGEFRPEDAITREEMAVVIVKTHQFRGGKLESGKISNFTDKDQIADWAVNYADQAVSTGFISGITATTFGPRENATRAQVTAVLNRMLNQ